MPFDDQQIEFVTHVVHNALIIVYYYLQRSACIVDAARVKLN